jgi:hypothetical protein
MLHILSILLALIVRQCILASPKLIVSSLILPDVSFAGVAVIREVIAVVASFQSGGWNVVDLGIDDRWCLGWRCLCLR